MNTVTDSAQIDQKQIGLYNKFQVTRTDGKDAPGEKHYGDEYFVLNMTTDRHAIPALRAYVKSCEKDYPQLAADLRAAIRSKLPSEFVTVPETTLPNGLVVPSFQVSRYMCTVVDGKATVSAFDAPTVEIDYHDANEACEATGAKLIRETQALALAWNIYNVDENWAGGKVGEGNLFQGLHKGGVSSVQANDYESEDPEERRWFMLSNGERVYDVAGHIFTWVFDDVQGNENGIVAKKFTEASPSISTAPYPSMEKGVGWRPKLPCDWSGYALIRGGHWGSGADAGVFALNGDGPDGGYGNVGFRCTK